MKEILEGFLLEFLKSTLEEFLKESQSLPGRFSEKSLEDFIKESMGQMWKEYKCLGWFCKGILEENSGAICKGISEGIIKRISARMLHY